MKQRFSKFSALQKIDEWTERIAKDQKFDRSNGTSQLCRLMDDDSEAILARAVEYGKMRALERFAEMIEEGFEFDAEPKAKP